MKIAHIIYAFPIGGTESMLVDILNEQVKYEQVSLIVVNNVFDRKLLSGISNKVSICLINRKSGSRNPIPFFRLNYFLVKNAPDIIHCHDYSIVRIVAPFLKARTVLTVHDMNICTKYHSKYDQLFAISKSVQNDIRNLSNNESVLVYNGVNGKDIQHKIEFKSSAFRVIQVSRLNHEKKGQHILLEALSILIHQYNLKDIHLDFIGEGTSYNHLIEMVDKFHLANYVSFLGLRDREYIYGHLKNYNILVQPSLFEGFGLTIVEAMAAGIEVLVSDIDGPREIIEKIGHGHMFKRGSADDCALNIYKSYTNRNIMELQSKSVLQRQSSMKIFDIEITAKNYLEEYKEVLKNNRI